MKMISFMSTKQRARSVVMICLLLSGVTSKVMAKTASAEKFQLKTASHRLATKPLSEMAKPVVKINPSRKAKMQAQGIPVPGDGSDYKVPNKEFPFKLKNKPASIAGADSKRQASKSLRAAPEPIQNFDGIPNVMGAVPPDTNGDVGPNHYVQTVNTALAVWDKQGNQLLAPVAINSLWSGLGGLCESTNRGDPIVLYDAMADRWLISQFAFNDAMTDNRQCIAVSQTPDPTGAYYVYDFAYSNTHFNDYPKFGVWHDGYYMSVNQFIGNSYAGVAVVAFERDAMLVGGEARQLKLDLAEDYPSLFSILPADHDGVLAPPADSPNYFFAVQDDWFHEAPADAIQIFAFDVDWSQPELTSFSLASEIQVAAMDMDIQTSEITQPNGIDLDSLRGYAMYRLAYRNFGDTASMVVNHSVDADSRGLAGIRWYQIDINNADNTISLNQQGTYAPADGIDRWMGSIAMDATGNIGLGYSATSASLNPSVYYTGRLAGDPVGEMSQGEGVMVTGGSGQGAVDRNRWADYSMMSVDPADDCTFWYTNEYYQAGDADTLDWSTRIASFKFPSCTALPTGTISGQVTDASDNQPVANVNVSVGGIATRTDSQGNYSLRLPVESYDLSLSSYWYQTATANGIEVAEDAQVVRDFTLDLKPTVTVSGVVSDGSGKGWPLYSEIEISIPDQAPLSTFTNPFTGEYSLDLVADIAVPLKVTSQLPGYQSMATDVTPVAGDNSSFVADYALTINSSECSAPGYISQGLSQTFSGDFLAEGWQSIDINGSGERWSTTATGINNVTGGDGEAALINSDAARTANIDTALVSPSISVASLDSTTLTYLANFQTFSGNDNFDLDISLDGDRWISLLAWTGNHGEFGGPGEAVSLDLAASIVGATSFQLRWHYYNAENEWFAQVDDIALDHSCLVADGGSLVAGFVSDENTQAAVNGVAVSAGSSSRSTPTADDPAIGDGLYFVFADTQTASLTASLDGYTTTTLPLEIVNSGLVRQDIELSAPLFSAEPSPVTMTMPTGVLRDANFNLTNNGSVDGSYSLLTVNSLQQAIPMAGRFEPGMRYSGPKDHTKINAGHIRDYRPPYVAAIAPGDVISQIDLDRSIFVYGIEINSLDNTFWVGSLSTGGFGGDDTLQQYTSGGVRTEQSIDLSSIINTQDGWFGDLAYHSRTDKFWVTEVDDNFCIHEIDQTAQALTGNTICPEGLAESQQGLAYDPLSNTFFSGSWNDSVIHRFDSQGTLISSINTGLAIAGLAYHPVSNRLYVSVNSEAPENDIVVLDAGDYSVIGGFNVMLDTDNDGVAEDVMDDLAQGGLAMACDGTLWVVEQDAALAYQIDVEETSACDWGEVDWLLLTGSGTIAGGESSELPALFNSEGLALGDYQARILVENSSPYGTLEVPVTLSVVEGEPGTLGFAVSAIEVDEEQDITLSIQRTDGSDRAVSIDYTTIDGTAVGGTDYTETSGTLSWDDLDAEAKVISVPFGTINQHKAFAVQLSNPQGGAALGENARLEIKVLDKPKGSGGFGLGALCLLLCVAASRRIYQQQ